MAVSSSSSLEYITLIDSLLSSFKIYLDIKDSGVTAHFKN